MTLVSTVVSGLYGVAAVAAVAIGYVVWQNRGRTGATALLGLVLGAWWWCAALFLASNASGAAVSAWLERSTYLGVGVIVASVLLFALAYTGRQHLITPQSVALVAVHPIAVAVFVVFNPGDAFFASIAPAPATVTGVAIEFGVAFWVHALYSYAVLAVSLLLLFGTMYRSRRLYRWQFVLLLLSILVTATANYAYIAGPVRFDTAPIGILVAAGLFTVAITRYGLMDIVPVARDQVLDRITDAVFVVDDERRLVDVNAAGGSLIAAVTGHTDPVGRDLETFFEAAPGAEALFEELTGGEVEQQTEWSAGGLDFEVTATPIAGQRDATGGWLFVVRDVTERRRRERQLQRRNEQLDRFASVVSHDLRNPLGVANGYVDLAEETGDLSHLEDVRAAHDRMETIIEDVLALARGAEAVDEPEPVSLAELAGTAWQSVETGDAELLARDDLVVADDDRLLRILENLFRNAVEHGRTAAAAAEDSAEGTDVEGDAEQPDLSVEVAPTDGGFYVADDGTGIPEADRETVFEGGYTTSEEGTGTGLGIVRQLAEAHGWSVRVVDAASGGARFEFDGVERPSG